MDRYEIAELTGGPNEPMKFLGGVLTYVSGTGNEEDRLTLDYSHHASNLKVIEYGKSLPLDQFWDRHLHQSFRSMLGIASYLTGHGYPWWAFEISLLASVANGPKIGDIQELNRVIKKIQRSPQVLTMRQLRAPHLGVFCDASFGNVAGTKTQVGKLIVLWSDDHPSLANTDSMTSIIAWGSNRLKRVCQSTRWAETLWWIGAVDLAYQIQFLLWE